MIKPQTAGELMRLLNEGRVNEIDPVWIKETYDTSLATTMAILANQSPIETVKKTALWGWLIFVDNLVLHYPEIVNAAWANYLIDEQERFAVWGVGI